MKIPRQFHLGGIVVTVEFDPNLHSNRRLIGEARYAEQKIVIDPTVAAADMTNQAFWHELLHYVLFIMNEHDLRNNERFVDHASGLFYQAIKSSTGEWEDYGKRGETSLEHNPKQLIAASEPLVPLSASLLDYACWLQRQIDVLVPAGSIPEQRQALKKIRELIDGEVARLERELVWLMVE